MGTVEYRVTPALGKGAMRYLLDGDSLVIESAKRGEKRSMALGEVRLVRLTFIAGVGRCELHTRGDKLVLMARSVRGVGDFVDQSADYLRFVRALHERLAGAAPNARYLGGTSFGFALGVIAVIAGVAAGAVAVIAAGADRGAMAFAPIAGALALGVPLMAAGRAKPYRPDALPERHLPR